MPHTCIRFRRHERGKWTSDRDGGAACKLLLALVCTCNLSANQLTKMSGEPLEVCAVRM